MNKSLHIQFPHVQIDSLSTEKSSLAEALDASRSELEKAKKRAQEQSGRIEEVRLSIEGGDKIKTFTVDCATVFEQL